MEIESAIEKLSPREEEELSDWLVRHTLNLKSQREAKMEAIRVSSGCLADEEGVDFEAEVREASNQIDVHDW